MLKLLYWSSLTIYQNHVQYCQHLLKCQPIWNVHYKVSTKNVPDVWSVQVSSDIAQFWFFYVYPLIYQPLSTTFKKSKTFHEFIHTSLLVHLVSPSLSTVLSERSVMITVSPLIFLHEKSNLKMPAVALGCPSHPLYATLEEVGASILPSTVV